MNTYKHLWACVAFLLTFFSTQAQNPVKWSFSSKQISSGVVELTMTGTLEEGWYTYSQFLESEDGPVATSVAFENGAHFALDGKADESGEKVQGYDKIFGMNLTKYKHKIVLTQRIKVNTPNTPVTGYLTYMCCNEEMCLPPKEVNFKFDLK